VASQSFPVAGKLVVEDEPDAGDDQVGEGWVKQHRSPQVADREIVYARNVSGDGGPGAVAAGDRDRLPGLGRVAVKSGWRVRSGEETAAVGVPANPPGQAVLLPRLQRQAWLPAEGVRVAAVVGRMQQDVPADVGDASEVPRFD